MDGGLLGNVLAPLGQLGRAFTPPSLDLSSYDGPEYRYRFLVFRPGLLRQEAVLLGAILLYVLFFWYGSSANKAKAKAWLSSHRTIYESQFAVPFDGGDASMGGGLIADGYTDFFAFSTGRRALASLHTVFALRPRHDLAQTLFAFAWKAIYDLSYEPRDELQLDFKLSDEFSSQGAGVPDFVFAVVAKDELRTVKDGRWDLTFTKTSDNNALPGSMSVMTEFADVTDAIFRAAPTLLTALKDPAIEPYFRSLSVTDQPRQYPAKVPFAREHHVILTLAVPPAKSAHVTQPLLRATFALVDALDKLSLRPETKTKLRKVREEFVVRHKDEAGREEREEKAEEKAVLKRRKEEERVMGMSAAEQAKALERDRKRSARKAQGKVVRK